jgi:hypothetical protein
MRDKVQFTNRTGAQGNWGGIKLTGLAMALINDSPGKLLFSPRTYYVAGKWFMLSLS